MRRFSCKGRCSTFIGGITDGQMEIADARNEGARSKKSHRKAEQDMHAQTSDVLHKADLIGRRFDVCSTEYTCAYDGGNGQRLMCREAHKAARPLATPSESERTNAQEPSALLPALLL